MKAKKMALTAQVRRQHGAVLAISLILLLIMTIIGVTAAQMTGLEEKMAGNFRDRNLAFQAAETALRAGEEKVKSLPACPILAAAANGGFYAHNSTPNIGDGDNSVWSTSNSAFNYTGVLLASTTQTAQPKYIIQCVNSAPQANSLYRITARGTGGTTDAVVILQSVYSR